MRKYWATSKDIIREDIPALTQKGWWLEYNPNIGMYRLNRKGNMPRELMGYSNHKKALVRQIMRMK